jgi:hypothetical protein
VVDHLAGLGIHHADGDDRIVLIGGEPDIAVEIHDVVMDEDARARGRPERPIGTIIVGGASGQRGKPNTRIARNVVQRPDNASRFTGRTRTFRDLHHAVGAANFGEPCGEPLLIHLQNLICRTAGIARDRRRRR